MLISSRLQLGVLERQWAEEQRQLRTRLITTDDLGFAWGGSVASAAPPPTPLPAAAADRGGVHEESASSATLPPLRLIGGVDISFVGDDTDAACAALVVVSYPDLKIVYERYEMVTMSAPYIAGFLAFREVDHLLSLLSHLRSTAPHFLPQLLLVDGNGLLHHRGFGLACHLGVIADIPTIGIGKNLLLVDGLDRSVVQARAAATLATGGESFDLVGTSGAVWGACLRATAAAKNPIYVSVGHRLSLTTAVELVRACCVNRIPEPVRLADLNSREYIRQWQRRQPLQTTRTDTGHTATPAVARGMMAP